MVLLLGSYDRDTYFLLRELKEALSRDFHGEGVYVFLLDNIELFEVENERTGFVIVELQENGETHAFFFDHSGEPIEEFEITQYGDKAQLSQKLYQSLTERLGLNVRVSPFTVLDKLDKLIDMAGLIIVVRDKEETRGGELVELTCCVLRGLGEKVCFMRREGIDLSSMVLELLDQARVVMRSYRDKDKLIQEVLRYTRHRIRDFRRELS